MVTLNYTDLTASWAFCFNDDCKVKDTCLRFLTSNLIPEHLEFCKMVLPKMAQKDVCNQYVSNQMVRKAWGFSKLFEEVKAKDATAIRHEMFDIIGSERTFYRCQRGERLVSPAQQEAILELFRSYGYTENLEFDNYVEDYDI